MNAGFMASLVGIEGLIIWTQRSATELHPSASRRDQHGAAVRGQVWPWRVCRFFQVIVISMAMSLFNSKEVPLMVLPGDGE